MKLHPGGITLVSDSQTDTSIKIVDTRFKYLFAKRGVYDYNTARFEVNLSTAGKGSLT